MPDEKRKKEILNEEADYDSMASFPASDPPSWTLGLKESEHKIRPPGEQPSHQNEPTDDASSDDDTA